MITFDEATNKAAMLQLKIAVQENPEYRFRLEEQEEALRSHPCINPEISSLLADNDIHFVLETLQLNEDVFAEVYPQWKISEAERRELATKIATHIEQCFHCSLKQGYDIESKQLFDRIQETHKEEFRQILSLVF